MCEAQRRVSESLHFLTTSHSTRARSTSLPPGSTLTSFSTTLWPESCLTGLQTWVIRMSLFSTLFRETHSSEYLEVLQMSTVQSGAMSSDGHRRHSRTKQTEMPLLIDSFCVADSNDSVVNLLSSTVRYKVWSDHRQACHGRFVRNICVIGVGDLHSLAESRQMFVNKLHADYQPMAYDCLEELHFNRTRADVLHPDRAFNTAYYERMPFVKYANRVNSLHTDKEKIMSGI